MRLGQAARFARGQDWIISRYNDYVTGKRLLAEELEALNRIMDRPERERKKTISASGAGRCMRERQFAYLGMPQAKLKPKTANIFANGDYMHLRHQVAGLVSGYLVDAEVSLENQEYGLTGTADGVTSDGELAEFKSINSYGFGGVKSFGPTDAHVLQVHSYMLLGGYDAARIVYENKDTQELLEFHVLREEERIEQVVRELEVFADLTSKEKLAPMLGECKEKKGAFNWCSYAEICAGAKAKDMEWTSQKSE